MVKKTNRFHVIFKIMLYYIPFAQQNTFIHPIKLWLSS